MKREGQGGLRIPLIKDNEEQKKSKQLQQPALRRGAEHTDRSQERLCKHFPQEPSSGNTHYGPMALEMDPGSKSN